MFLRAGPFRQDSFHEPLFWRCGNHSFGQQCDSDAVDRRLEVSSASHLIPTLASTRYALSASARFIKFQCAPLSNMSSMDTGT